MGDGYAASDDYSESLISDTKEVPEEVHTKLTPQKPKGLDFDRGYNRHLPQSDIF